MGTSLCRVITMAMGKRISPSGGPHRAVVHHPLEQSGYSDHSVMGIEWGHSCAR